ncbi:MAG: type II toxin-antitoxin system RelE/ParE family toxin [Ruminiclostridium sp.]|nr:type II toxin-antitoxin system RelE/ParE family toxin [Ruminiclostridium sp.]
MYKLRISELAHSDLDGIVSYIAIVLSNPVAASNFMKELEKHYGHLKNNPYMYEMCNNLRLQRENYRRVPINNYVLIYKVNEEDKIINIYRIFYGRQDYLKLI